jgi:peptidoglycan/LPS O-acetylase OafA/YrhL
MAGTKENNFGTLRLMFAAAVILAHSPEILDGNRTRELITRIFGSSESFGSLGVDGFFIISGFLVTISWLSTDGVADYAKRRILRIYPGFVVASLICAFLVAPLFGPGLNALTSRRIASEITRLPLLMPPHVGGVFPGLPYQELNVPMWTIAYEFRCYILVALLGMATIFSRQARFLLLPIALACLVAAGFIDDDAGSGHGLVSFLFGSAGHNVRLFGMFGAGMVFALFRDRIPLLNSVAALAAVALILGLFSSLVSNLAIGVAGAYLIFWVAYRAPVLSLSRFTNRTDLSFGIYLYAWPIQSAIAFLTHRAMNPWAMSGVTLVLAASAAWLSWTFIEGPAMCFAHRPIPFSFPSLLPREAFGRGAGLKSKKP